jgi:hypothetical protein
MRAPACPAGRLLPSASPPAWRCDRTQPQAARTGTWVQGRAVQGRMLVQRKAHRRHRCLGRQLPWRQWRTCPTAQAVGGHEACHLGTAATIDRKLQGRDRQTQLSVSQARVGLGLERLHQRGVVAAHDHKLKGGRRGGTDNHLAQACPHKLQGGRAQRQSSASGRPPEAAGTGGTQTCLSLCSPRKQRAGQRAGQQALSCAK